MYQVFTFHLPLQSSPQSTPDCIIIILPVAVSYDAGTLLSFSPWLASTAATPAANSLVSRWHEGDYRDCDDSNVAQTTGSLSDEMKKEYRLMIIIGMEHSV